MRTGDGAQRNTVRLEKWLTFVPAPLYTLRLRRWILWLVQQVSTAHIPHPYNRVRPPMSLVLVAHWSKVVPIALVLWGVWQLYVHVHIFNSENQRTSVIGFAVEGPIRS